MPRRQALVASLGGAAAYAVALVLGRMLVIPGETLSIVWPACGVATLWVLGRRGGDLALALALVVGTTVAVGTLLGESLGLTAAFGLVNAAQALVAATMLRRLCPDLWGCGGTATFDGVGRVFRLLSAAVVSSLVAALIAAVGLSLLVARPTATDLAIHWGRNVYGFLAVVSVVHLVAHAWRWRSRDSWGAALPAARAPELALLTATTLVVFGVSFLQTSLPLAFVPAAVTIWAGLRFSSPVVAVHATLASALALGATVAGHGPFALVADVPQRGLLVQLLMTILLVKGLSLAAVRADQRHLLREVEDERRSATAQAGLLSTIMDTIRPGVVVLDGAGRPARRNEPAAALLAMQPTASGTASGTASDTASDSPGGAWASVWCRAAAREAAPPFDLRLDGPEGRVVVEVRPTPLREEGARIGTVVLLTDVTAERAAREGLTGFAGTVAHDLRVPLSGIRGWSHALSDELAAEDTDLALATAMVGRVVTAGARMDDMIGDLLADAVSRDAALEPTTIALDQVTREVVETVETAGHVVVVDHVEVHADVALVRQLVGNLVGNAIKYVAPGTVPHVVIRSRYTEGMVEVRVRDNGIGIPPDQRERVFEQLHRAHANYPGTGLGLAICRTIVQRHGGEIWAEAADGGGTCMVFTLPSPPRGATGSEPAARALPPAASPQLGGTGPATAPATAHRVA